MLVMQFSNGRSIDNQWHANYEENKAKILSYRSINEIIKMQTTKYWKQFPSRAKNNQL